MKSSGYEIIDILLMLQENSILYEQRDLSIT
jgi:hypothetical protein